MQGGEGAVAELPLMGIVVAGTAVFRLTAGVARSESPPALQVAVRASHVLVGSVQGEP